MAQRVRVLSLDGGGIRGLIPALVLESLEKRTGKPVAELFDLIAGTSTGAILALGLTLPGDNGRPRFRAGQIAELYIERGREIFPRSVLKRISSLDGVNDERYDSDGIERVFQDLFGGVHLKDALVDVLIPAYEIERRQPFLFRSRYARKPPRNEVFDYPMWQVARSTSAAPTYFEPFELKAPDGARYALVDGGVYANNPAMCALVEIQSLMPDAEVELVSLGTGELCRSLPYAKAKNWGLVGWARPILEVVFDGVSDTVDFQVAQLLKEHFHRFQARLDESSDDLDDVNPKNLDALRAHAERLIADSDERLDKVAHVLV